MEKVYFLPKVLYIVQMRNVLFDDRTIGKVISNNAMFWCNLDYPV